MVTRPRHPNYDACHAMLAAGASLDEVCAAFPVSRGLVVVWRNKMGLTPPRKHNVNPLREQARALAAEGLNLSEVGRRLGITRNSARQAVLGCKRGIRAIEDCDRAAAILEFLREPGPWEAVRAAWLTGLRRHIERLRENAHAR